MKILKTLGVYCCLFIILSLMFIFRDNELIIRVGVRVPALIDDLGVQFKCIRRI